MKLKELAERIDAHLKRFEADDGINTYQDEGRTDFPYWNVGAGPGGRYVYVTYVSYQGPCHLTRAEAEKYLAWLDAGNVGKHWQALRG